MWAGPDFSWLLKFHKYRKSVPGNSKNKAVRSWFECEAEFGQVWMLYVAGAKRFLAWQQNDG